MTTPIGVIRSNGDRSRRLIVCGECRRSGLMSDFATLLAEARQMQLTVRRLLKADPNNIKRREALVSYDRKVMDLLDRGARFR